MLDKPILRPGQKENFFLILSRWQTQNVLTSYPLLRYVFTMSTSLTIPVSKKEQERLTRLALSYGLSLSEFSKRILSELASEIPEESFDDYEHPEALRASLRRALSDWRARRVSTTL